MVSSEELRSFRVYCTLPEHQEKIIALHLEILDAVIELKESGEETESNLEPQLTALFGTLDHQANYLSRVRSELLGCLREFLAWQEWRGQETAVKFHLLQYARRNKLDRQFERILRSEQKRIDRGTRKSRENFWAAFELSRLNVLFLNQHNKRREAQAALIEMKRRLEMAYARETIANMGALISAARTFNNASTPQEDIEQFLARIERRYATYPLIVRLYYHAILTLDGVTGEENYRKLKALVVDHAEEIRREDLKDLYDHLFNFCRRRARKDRKRFVPEISALYQQFIGTPELKAEDKPSLDMYKTMVTFFVMEGYFDEAREFINENQAVPLEDEGNRIRMYCRGILDFYDPNCDEEETYRNIYRLTNAILVGCKDELLKRQTRILQWKCMVMTNDLDSIGSADEAVRKVIERDKVLSKDRKAIYRDLVRFSTQMVQLTLDRDFKQGKRFSGKVTRLRNDLLGDERDSFSLRWLQKEFLRRF